MNSSFSSVSSIDYYSDDDSDDGLLMHQQTYRIRLYAANLPVKAGVMFRGKVCDSFAVVSSTESMERVQQSRQDHHPHDNSIYASASPSASATHLPPRPSHRRNSSIASNRSSTSTSASSSTIWGQTEVVHKSSNPQWTKAIPISYKTGSNTFFYVHLFRHAPGQKEHLQSFGTALFHVTDLLSTKNCTRVKRLRNGGCVFCRLELVKDHANMHRTVRLKLQVLQLVLPGGKSTALLRRSGDPDTVLEIAKRETATGLWLVVCRSAPVYESLSPVYDRVQMDLESLCEGNLDCPLRLQIMLVHRGSFTASGHDHSKCKLIGMTETTLRHILKNPGVSTSTEVEQHISLENSNDSMNPDEDDNTVASSDDGAEQKPRMLLRLQRNSTKVKDVGRLAVLLASIRSENEIQGIARDDETFDNDNRDAPAVAEIVDLTTLVALPSQIPGAGSAPARSFSSYIQDGCQIDFCVAVDFTSSNGDPRQRDSYHYLSDNTLNDYEETILAIGKSLEKYSKTQEYSVYGFGAKFGGQIRHIFQCGPTPTVQGVDGILQAYKSVFDSDLIMSGPTVFHHVLQAAAVRAKRHHDIMRQTPSYTVLLVITDGAIAPSDFHETRLRLDAYSNMPLSIVFVGVGRSDLRSMFQLCRATPSGVRSNTAFVEFRRHQHDPAALGAAALRHVPAQLCEYMRRQGL